MQNSEQFKKLAASVPSKLKQVSAQAAQKTLDLMRVVKSKAVRPSKVFVVGSIASALCAVGAVAIAPIAPDAANLPVKTVKQDLTVPDIEAQVAQIILQNHSFIREEKIRSGDTLSSLFNRLGVHDSSFTQFVKSDHLAKDLIKAKAGKLVRVKTDSEGQVEWLRVALSSEKSEKLDRSDRTDKAEKSEKSDKASEKEYAKNEPSLTLVINRKAQGAFISSKEVEQLERRVEMRSAEIQSTFFMATEKAMLPQSVENQLVKMFETNVDFRKLQRGDFFNVVYETYWSHGELVKTGRLLSGEFKNAGKLHQAVWFNEGSGEGGYYSLDGKALKKAFLKSPLEFSRISSGFSMRVHPISGQWKQHKGVDFAAAHGTPIRASADGVVDFASTQRGYGNVVEIKHWSGISTAYAHMSRFASGIRKGTKVTQGQVIGYVGSTGWSTGPHLHYEFRVNDVPKDPTSVKVESQAQLTQHDLPKFKAVAQDMTHRFDLLRPEKSEMRAEKMLAN